MVGENVMTRAEWTNTLPNVGTGAIKLGVQRDFYAGDSDSGSDGYSYGWARIDRHAPRVRYTWYDNYLWKRYGEMRRLAEEEYQTIPINERRYTGPMSPIRADVVRIDRYTTDFYERYLRNRKYYRGSDTVRT